MHRLSETLWEIPASHHATMHVPVRIVATAKCLRHMDNAVFEQLVKVAALPGIQAQALGMPDCYSSIAAVEAESGVIAPGAIGFDINCGIRLLTTDLTYAELMPRLPELLEALHERIPSGIGTTGLLKLSPREFREVAEKGSRWCHENGYASADDLAHTEDRGCATGADSAAISDAAIARGIKQVGTLGAGNHSLRLYMVRPENIFDGNVAQTFGISRRDQILVVYQCGSRAFGHQVTRDALRSFQQAGVRAGGLACAPFLSTKGMAYFSALKCAVNLSFANRQIILHAIRQVFREVFRRRATDPDLRVVYDVAHNTARIEQHWVMGKARDVLVHRKGSIRAFGPGAPGIPEAYKQVGQPVLLGGGGGEEFYLHHGLATGEKTFYSTVPGIDCTAADLSALSYLAGISRPVVKLVPVPRSSATSSSET